MLAEFRLKVVVLCILSWLTGTPQKNRVIVNTISKICVFASKTAVKKAYTVTPVLYTDQPQQ